jgi:hypothetical protein
MIPLTYINEAKASVSSATSSSWSNDLLATAFRRALSRVWSAVPACRLTASGPLVDPSTVAPVVPSNWGTEIWLDDAYGPALVEGMLAFLFGSDADDTFDLSVSQMHEKNFKGMLGIPG